MGLDYAIVLKLRYDRAQIHTMSRNHTGLSLHSVFFPPLYRKVAPASRRNASHRLAGSMQQHSLQPASQISKADRAKVAHYVEQTLTIVPCKSGLTLDDIESIINPFQVVLIKDEETGVFWSRGTDISKKTLLTRLSRGSLGRFLCRGVGGDRRDAKEKSRLATVLENPIQSKPRQSFEANENPSTSLSTPPFDIAPIADAPPTLPVSSLLSTGHTLDRDTSSDERVLGHGNPPSSSTSPSIENLCTDLAEAAPDASRFEGDNNIRTSRSRTGSPPTKKARLSNSPESSRLPGSDVSASRELTAPPAPLRTSPISATSSSAPPSGSAEEVTPPAPQPTGHSTLQAEALLTSTASASAAVSVSDPTSSTSQQVRPPPPTFDDVMRMTPRPSSKSFDYFPSEVIAEIALYRMADSIEPSHQVQTLLWFYRLSPRSLHPTTSSRFTKYILRRSRVPISVYYTPQPSPVKKWQRFPKFLKLIKSAGPRWTKVQVVIEREHLDGLMDALEEHHPLLSWLSISVTGPTMEFSSLETTETEGGATLEEEDATMEEADRASAEAYSSAGLPRPFNILLGKTEHLHHVDLQNMGLRFNPILLNNLSSLYLSDGVRVAYGEFLSWFNIGATNLEVLHLSNLDWLDALPAPPAETDRAFLLDRLTSLTLIEKATESGLTNLLYYISAPVCLRLRLESLSMQDFFGERLAAKLLPILSRTLAGQSCTHLNVSAKPTRGEFTWLALPDSDVSDSFGTGFDIVYTCPNGPGQPSDFLEFIGHVMERLDHRPAISLDINDTCSGELGSETETGEPCLSPEDFEPIMMDVMNIWGKVTRGHFYPLRGFLTMWATNGVQAAFPCISCVHLEYLPNINPSSDFTMLELDAMLSIISPSYGQIEAEEDTLEGLVTLTRTF
ncbi:hypothetical protein FRB90_007121 [Tulasnella sp. 427]|nr:hypothetical protein FRB90_007121 [Tulasnella sp. 427]